MSNANISGPMNQCNECQAVIAESDPDVGHRPGCPRNEDDGSAEASARWLASRPPAVREAFFRYPPTKMYRLKVEGGIQDVQIVSYHENDDGTVTSCRVVVFGGAMRLPTPYEVFGVPLVDLMKVKAA